MTFTSLPVHLDEGEVITRLSEDDKFYVPMFIEGGHP